MSSTCVGLFLGAPPDPLPPALMDALPLQGMGMATGMFIPWLARSLSLAGQTLAAALGWLHWGAELPSGASPLGFP